MCTITNKDNIYITTKYTCTYIYIYIYIYICMRLFRHIYIYIYIKQTLKKESIHSKFSITFNYNPYSLTYIYIY